MNKAQLSAIRDEIIHMSSALNDAHKGDGQVSFERADVYKKSLIRILGAAFRSCDAGGIIKIGDVLYGHGLDYYLLEQIKLSQYSATQGKRIKNLTVSTLLKYYQTPGSGRKSYASRELKKRFDHQSSSDQRKILSAFIDSNKSDRKWACIRLYRNWDPTFENQIASAWSAYKEQTVAYVIVKHFHESYVYEQRDSLAPLVDYWAICARLGRHPGFTIRWENLSISDELFVRAKLEMAGDEQSLIAKLYAYLIKQCEVAHKYLSLKLLTDESTLSLFCNYYDCNRKVIQWVDQPWTVLSIFHFPEMGSIVNSLSRIGMKDTLIELSRLCNELYQLESYALYGGQDSTAHKAEVLQGFSDLLKKKLLNL